VRVNGHGLAIVRHKDSPVPCRDRQNFRITQT